MESRTVRLKRICSLSTFHLLIRYNSSHIRCNMTETLYLLRFYTEIIYESRLYSLFKFRKFRRSLRNQVKKLLPKIGNTCKNRNLPKIPSSIMHLLDERK